MLLTIFSAIYPFNAVSHINSTFYKPADFKIYLQAIKLKGSSSTIRILVVLIYPTSFSESISEFSSVFMFICLFVFESI